MDLSTALPILRALSDGVNPATGETFPDDSPYCEPKTLRAVLVSISSRTSFSLSASPTPVSTGSVT